MLECYTFVVGDIFRTYEALERKLEEYKKTHYVEFWKRDNRTIETARRRMPHRFMKDDLRYYEIKWLHSWWEAISGERLWLA